MEYALFPIEDSGDFEIRTAEDYKHLIYTIVAETVNLEMAYPDKHVLVVYEIGDKS